MFRPVDFMINAKVTNKLTKISVEPSLSNSYGCQEVTPHLFINLEDIWHENCIKKKVSAGEGSGVQSGKMQFLFFVLSYKPAPLNHFCVCDRKVMASSKGKYLSLCSVENFPIAISSRRTKCLLSRAMLSGLSVQLAVNATAVTAASGTATI